MRKAFVISVLFIISFLGNSQENDHFNSMFNGKDLSNWVLIPAEKPPGFCVSEGTLFTNIKRGSDIYTIKKYGNFILKFEYLLSDISNSGVFIRWDPQNKQRRGVEIQLLAPWTPYRDDLHCTGSIYGHVAVNNRPDETTGIWHQMEIKCDRKLITVSVDGQVTTMAYTDTVESMQNKPLTGAIGFQSNHAKERQYIRFRNIFIRDLDIESEYIASGFYDKDIRIRKLARSSAVSLGSPMIEVMAKMMNEEKPVAQSGAKQVLFDIVARATSPGLSVKERKIVARQLKQSIKKCYSEITIEYLKWLYRMISKV